MKRYEVEMARKSSVVPVNGLVQAIVATAAPRYVFYVKDADVAAFERTLKACGQVLSFSQRALDLEGRLQTGDRSQTTQVRRAS